MGPQRLLTIRTPTASGEPSRRSRRCERRPRPLCRGGRRLGNAGRKTMSRRIIVVDAWSQRQVSLTRAQASEISASELADVTPVADDSWLVVTNSRVGIAVGADWELRVNPKLDVGALMFLLAYANDPKGWRDQPAEFAVTDDLFDAVAVGFSLHALEAVQRGALHGYRHVDERLTGIRGRVR